MSEREVKVIYVYPPGRGPGGHHCHYMAYWIGEELFTGDERPARGWGDTAREAMADLQKQERDK